MRKFKLNKWVTAGLMVAMPYAGMVDAAGLGRLNVLSQLGQPFAAEIDLVNVTKEELATLKATLASPSAYEAANLQFNPALNALRMSVERRPNGTSYIRATSFRPVAEPFLDLLVELSWAGGKIVREYSALLDPPGMETPAAAVTPPSATPPSAQSAPAVTSAPPGKPSAAPAPAPAARAAAPTPPPARAAAGQYTVKSGDTLSGIARQVGPEGVSLEQTLVGLFQANPDAFYGGNINQLRAGKILNVPEREQLAVVAQGEAAQQVRTHAANWNIYRRTVADAAPVVADAAPAAKGRITARVEDQAGAKGPKDVVVLSKGDTGADGAAKGKSAGERVRALEEDVAARDKALTEANSRVAQLEKTLKEMQKLAEVKNSGLAAAQQAAKAPEPKPEAKPAAKAEEAKADAPKAEPAKPEPPKPEAKAETKAEAPKAADTPPPSPPTAKPAAEAPKKAVTPPPPPPPEPSLMDTVMENIVPIGGAAALLAGLVGIWALRRRRQDATGDDEPIIAPTFKSEPFKGNVDAATSSSVAAAPLVSEATVANVTDVVDPIDEAQVYIDHGRDPQAEEILKEAMGKQPQREDIPLKLLEVYAARGDRTAFNSLASAFHKQTGGVGDNWKRAAALGYAIDPTNPLYPSTGEVVDLAAARDTSGNVDLDIGGSPQNAQDANDDLAATTDILLDQGNASVDMEKTMVLPRGDIKYATQETAPGAMPDFNIELPPDGSPEKPAPAANTGNMVEFNIDLPPASAPAITPAAKAEDPGLDFKVDFSNINLNLDDAPASSAAAPEVGGKDAHWEDVQQKFDLARAYQEMGDKEGAMEILHEVEREGDTEQKAEAQKMIQSLK